MRRLLPTLTTLALVVTAVPAQAQLSFGVQGSVITRVQDVDVGGPDLLELAGTYGIGGRAVVSPPVFPLSLVGSFDYFFPECGAGDCSLYTAQGHVTLGLPLPIVRPYLLGGWQYRKDEFDSTTGAVIGGGVSLNFVVSLFLEMQVEFADAVALGDSNPTVIADLRSPVVIKGGVVF